MLNKAERHQVLKSFRIYSIIGLFPTEVDVENWELKKPSKIKKFVCALSYSFFVLHALYKIGSLSYIHCLVPNVPLHQMVIHAVVAVCSAMMVFWYYVVYLADPVLVATYVKITLVGNAGGIVDKRDDVRRDWKRRLRQYSLQDLIAISLPYMCILALIVTIAAYIYDRSMRLLLYAALPDAFQTWTTFGLCLLEEIRFFLIFMALVVPVFQMQVLSYDLVSNQLKLAQQAVENGTQRIWGVHRLLRSLQLYVSLVNGVNSYLIFTWKLVSISMGVLSGYAAIAHFSEFPIFGIMYYVLVFDVTLIYTLIYDKAFKIPELFGQVAGCALLRLRGKQNNILRRQIQSVPRPGIRVGGFHTMERESTLIFMDFVVKNIVNMLVAYG